MRLVSPTCDIPNERAESLACHAKDVFQNAKIFNSVENCVSDLQVLYATSARERAVNKKTVTPKELEIIDKKTGILFGPENNGLSNIELSLAKENNLYKYQ